MFQRRDPDQNSKADVAQLVEQRFRKPQVSSSILLVGFASGDTARRLFPFLRRRY
jgi:hypothetical protein